MRRTLVALLLLASPLLAQAPNGWAPIENGWAEIQVTAPTGTVTTTGTLASGQVALGSGATSITGDAGLTYSGTGAGFKLGIGTDVFLSSASAGLLLVEDGSGAARDLQARTGTFGTSVVTPVVSGGANATGTNIAGTTTTVAGQLGTGSGASGDQVFTVGTPQASGTTQHVAATALTLHNAGSTGTAAPQALFANGSRTVPSISFGSGTNYGLYADIPNGALLWVTNATQQISVGAGAVSMGPSETLGWVAAANTLSSTLQDTAFRRVSAGVSALGAGPTGFNAEFTTGTHSTQTANGAKENWSQTSELVTLDTGGTSTVTAGNLAPANAIIDSITYRITTTIATATAFTIKVTGGNVFSNIGTATTSQTTLTSGTTGVLVPSAFADQYNTSATTLTVTTTGTPSAGVMRITTNWRVFVPPTS